MSILVGVDADVFCYLSSVLRDKNIDCLKGQNKDANSKVKNKHLLSLQFSAVVHTELEPTTSINTSTPIFAGQWFYNYTNTKQTASTYYHVI